MSFNKISFSKISHGFAVLITLDFLIFEKYKFKNKLEYKLLQKGFIKICECYICIINCYILKIFETYINLKIKQICYVCLIFIKKKSHVTKSLENRFTFYI